MKRAGDPASGEKAAREHDPPDRGHAPHQRQPRPDTVLQEIAESARALTRARYGGIATIDGAGEPEDFVTSGLTRRGILAAGPVAQDAETRSSTLAP